MFANIQGDYDTLVARSGNLQTLASRLRVAKTELTALKQQSSTLGQNSLREGIDPLLDGYITNLDDMAKKSETAAAVMSGLAETLRDIDAEEAKRKIEWTHSSLTVSMPYLTTDSQSHANHARHSAERELLALLPKDVQDRFNNLRLYGAPSLGDFLSDTWNEGIVANVSGLWDSLQQSWSMGVFGYMTDREKFHQSWQSYGDLINGLVTDRGPDGSPGFRDLIINEMVNKDLLDKDPAAWVATLAITLALGKGVGAATKATSSLGVASKVTDALSAVTAGNMFRRMPDLKAGGVALSPTARAIDANSVLRGRYAITTHLAGIWDLVPTGTAGRGAMVEKLIKAIRLKQIPDASDLSWPHPKIDLASVAENRVISIKSIDPASKTYATDPNKFYSVLNGYADEIGPERYPLPWARLENGAPPLPFNDPKRGLDIGIPSDGLTPEHVKMLEKLVQNHPELDIMIIESPR